MVNISANTTSKVPLQILPKGSEIVTRISTRISTKIEYANIDAWQASLALQARFIHGMPDLSVTIILSTRR